MKIKSFGCSFIFGHDLADDGRYGAWPNASRLTWPALCAEKLGLEYECWAKGGAGNLQICNFVLDQAAADVGDAIFVIGWSYSERFDYVEPYQNVARIKWHTISPWNTNAVGDFYYRHLHSQFRDVMTTLFEMRLVSEILRARQIPFLMTSVDLLPLESVNSAPSSVIECQQHLRKLIRTFDGEGFPVWAKQQGFEISDTGHPLEPAHRAAADIMLPEIQALLNSKNSRS